MMRYGIMRAIRTPATPVAIPGATPVELENHAMNTIIPIIPIMETTIPSTDKLDENQNKFTRFTDSRRNAYFDFVNFMLSTY